MGRRSARDSVGRGKSRRAPATHDVSEMNQSAVHRPVFSSVALCRVISKHPCSAGLCQQSATQDNTNENGSSLLWVQEVGSSNLLSPTSRHRFDLSGHLSMSNQITSTAPSGATSEYRATDLTNAPAPTKSRTGGSSAGSVFLSLIHISEPTRPY